MISIKKPARILPASALKAIKQELGEADENAVETEEYRKKIEEKNLPGVAKEQALRRTGTALAHESGFSGIYGFFYLS